MITKVDLKIIIITYKQFFSPQKGLFRVMNTRGIELVRGRILFLEECAEK